MMNAQYIVNIGHFAELFFFFLILIMCFCFLNTRKRNNFQCLLSPIVSFFFLSFLIPEAMKRKNKKIEARYWTISMALPNSKVQPISVLGGVGLSHGTSLEMRARQSMSHPS